MEVYRQTQGARNRDIFNTVNDRSEYESQLGEETMGVKHGHYVNGGYTNREERGMNTAT
jgi:hypothetical protein